MGDQYVCKECNSFNMAEMAVPLSLPVVDAEDNYTCGWCAEIKRLKDLIEDAFDAGMEYGGMDESGANALSWQQWKKANLGE